MVKPADNEVGQPGIDRHRIRAAADALGWSAVSVGKGGTPFKPSCGVLSHRIDRAVERDRVLEQIGRRQGADRENDHCARAGGHSPQRVGGTVSQHISAWVIHIHRAAHRDGQIQGIQISRTGGVAGARGSPTDDRAVGLERQTVPGTGRNRHDMDRIGGNRGLAVVVVAPAEDSAVGLKRKTEVIARCNRHHIRRIGGNVGNAVRVVSLA